MMIDDDSDDKEDAAAALKEQLYLCDHLIIIEVFDIIIH
jgi:hypothetical protein